MAAPRPEQQDTDQPAVPFGQAKHGLLPLEGQRYFTASELDERPVLMSSIDMERHPLTQPEGGYLLLRLLIDETGVVEDVLVVTNDTMEELEKVAAKAFSDARFSPGILHGVPVRSQVLLEVKLEPAFADAPK